MPSHQEEKIKIGSEAGRKVNCSMCGKEGTTDEFTTLRGEKDKDVHLCAECKEKTNQAFAAETKNPNIVLAIVGGVVGGTIGGVVWYGVAVSTGREIGYISLALGFLVGLGVHLGSGRKRGHQLQIISALVALAAIVVTKKFIVDYFLRKYFSDMGDGVISQLLESSASISFFDPLFWKNMISPIGLLIMAVGIYIAYAYCRPRKI